MTNEDIKTIAGGLIDANLERMFDNLSELINETRMSEEERYEILDYLDDIRLYVESK